VIGWGSPASIRGHYHRVAGWRIGLANWETLNFSLLDLCALGLIVGGLARTCQADARDPGQILTTFGYVTMFMSGLLNLPTLVRQFSRLHDICGRFNDDPPDCR
jgi:hypothetical protein